MTRALVIAGVASGVGKTSLTLGLLEALRRARLHGRVRRAEHEASDPSVVRHLAGLWDNPAADGVPLATYDTAVGVLTAPAGALFDAVAGVLSGVEAMR